MGVFDKFKDSISKFVNVTDSDYEEYDEQVTETPAKEERKSFSSSHDWEPDSNYAGSRVLRTEKSEKKGNVVSIDGNRGHSVRTIGDSQVVVKKVSGVAEVGSAADILKQGKIVVLNLEECPIDALQRVIDILYGVTYALDGSFNSIAEKAFVITPYNVSVSSEDYSELGETDFE